MRQLRQIDYISIRTNMNIDDVLHYIAGAASSNDLYRIQYALRNVRFECLFAKVPDDLILHICSFLASSKERLAFARALYGCARALDEILLQETAVASVRRIVQSLGERDLYSLPSCLQMRTYFVCNWTAFSSSCPTHIAQTFWASRSPHARVECRTHAIHRVVRDILDRGCAVLRISSHLEAHGASAVSKRVRFNGRYTHILNEPLQTQEIVLLPPRLVLMLQSRRASLQTPVNNRMAAAARNAASRTAARTKASSRT